ncbi:MAG: SdpI family protein [Dehalococcoidia bacterium]
MAVVFLIIAAGSALVLAIGIFGLIGKLPRNGWAGIRTPYTMRSDENWQRTHRFGSPLLIFGSVATLSASLAFLPFALAGKVGDGLAGAVSIGCAVVLGTSAIASWLYGVNRAKSSAP